ncbi:TcdA/TcdB catalytic glycosyltransferase domain-containing protein, partial [Vibrio anguillarum]
YELEMYLRGNLAAASDIARLVILRQYGGLYVDVDTLPVSEGIFNETYGYEGENDFNLNKIVDALKMEVVLSELHGRGLIPFENSKKV